MIRPSGAPRVALAVGTFAWTLACSGVEAPLPKAPEVAIAEEIPRELLVVEPRTAVAFDVVDEDASIRRMGA